MPAIDLELLQFSSQLTTLVRLFDMQILSKEDWISGGLPLLFSMYVEGKKNDEFFSTFKSVDVDLCRILH
jgi:hypothetical protein